MKDLKVGLVGYSDAKYDEGIAKTLILIAMDLVEDNHEADEYKLVSGLTDLGIPGLGYKLAEKTGWKTVGFSAKEAKEYKCFPVDEEIIVGEKFGSESTAFINYIDVLIRIGGGKQTFDEVKMAKERGIAVYEFDLPEKQD